MRAIRLSLATALLACTPAMAQVAAKAPAQDLVATQERCDVLFESGGEIKNLLLMSLRVLNLADSAKFKLPPDAPPKVKAVRCGRDVIVPQRNDYKVLQAGYPFSIVAGDRVGVLELAEGNLRYRLLKGELTAAEIPAVTAFINASQRAMVKKAPAAPTAPPKRQ